jgi:glycosyltransferase involved in cell wall biosynthesis
MTERVAFFLPSLLGGGAERVVLGLAGDFAQQEISVDLVLAAAEGPYLADVHPRVRLIDLKAGRVLASLLPLIRYLRAERPAAMLSTLDHANVVALWAKRLARVPTRLWVREASTHSQTYRHPAVLRANAVSFLMGYSYRWAEGVIAPSHDAAADLARYVSLREGALHVICNPVIRPALTQQACAPVEHPWFAPGALPLVLSVGRLSEAKDFATLIRAFAQVRRQTHARLVILGEGELRVQLESLVQSLGLARDVLLPGFVANPYAYMARASVYVLSSRWEGLPNALIEALALGTPVVATDCESGPREILDNGRYGRLVPVGDTEALAAAVTEVLTRREKAAPDAAFMQRFSADACVARYRELLLAQ